MIAVERITSCLFLVLISPQLFFSLLILPLPPHIHILLDNGFHLLAPYNSTSQSLSCPWLMFHGLLYHLSPFPFIYLKLASIFVFIDSLFPYLLIQYSFYLMYSLLISKVLFSLISSTTEYYSSLWTPGHWKNIVLLHFHSNLYCTIHTHTFIYTP